MFGKIAQIITSNFDKRFFMILYNTFYGNLYFTIEVINIKWTESVYSVSPIGLLTDVECWFDISAIHICQ